MRVCSACRCALHPDQSGPRAIVAVYQAGRQRRYSVCHECAARLEQSLGRRPEPARRPSLEPSR